MSKLTIKQERFARAYIETGNASEAYRRAYEPKKMSDEAVAVEACRLLKSPKVALMVEQLQQAAAKRNEITVDRIVRELSLIGFANMLDYIQTQEDGSAYIDLSKLSREQAAAIGEVTSETYYEGGGEDAKAVKRTKFKLIDKRGALVDLGKHLGMFEKDNAQKGDAIGKAIAEANDIDQARRVAFALGRALERQRSKVNDAA